MHLVAVFGIDIGQEPVAEDVGLDSPCKRELALFVDKIDKACFWVANTSSRLLDGVYFVALLGLSSS